MQSHSEEEDMIKINKRKILFAALVLLLSGILIGQQMVQAKPDSYEDLKAFTQALELVKRNYVENPDSRELLQGAIKGMVSSLDPHSSYMNEKAFKDMNVDIRGEFTGVGIQIGIKNQQLTVIAPIEDTPGFRAGLAAGDKIMKINDEWTKDLSIEQAVDKMRGPKGTAVKLLIYREGWDKPKDFKITRDVIKVVSVKSKMLDNEIGYVKIIQFQGQTAEELEAALKKLETGGMKKLVIDLRNDPGGLLDASVDVSSKFLGKDKLVVYLQGRQANDRKDFLTTGGTTTAAREYPIVVLVNTGSASASEIVAGALQDSKRALILGTQTFGKGSVQTVFPLEGGGGIRLTTAKYYTPSGRSIQNVGITPDVEVKLPVVKEAKEGDPVHMVVREKDLDRHLKNDTVKEEKKKKSAVPVDEEDFALEVMPKEDKDDIQLQKAIDILKPALKAEDVFKGLPVAAKKDK
jgi:carboxyl-terminal processing protease